MTTSQEYLAAIRQGVEANNLTERSYYSALKMLVEAIGGKDVVVAVEPKRIECGAPDFTVARQTPHGPLTVGHIEAKDVGVPLDEVDRSVQLKRYRNALPNLLLTDYLEFRWYVDGEHRRTERLARVSKDSKIIADTEGGGRVAALIGDFLAHTPEPIATPRDLARRMARLTHIIRDIIIEAFEKDRATEMLRGLRQAFATALIPDLTQPYKTAEFADMYAQTIAYGLFAARSNHRGPGRFQRLGAAAEIPKTNPFLRKLFETITGTELDDEPYAGFVDDLAQLLAHTQIEAVLEAFGKRETRQDPVVHFYETFLADYDPALRETRGVYYTPEPVVSYIVRSVDHLLKTHFGLADGLADRTTVEYERGIADGGRIKRAKTTAPRVLILDPACGTGTFLYSVVDLIREQFMVRGDAGMWSGYVRNHLLPRLFGFELLMAPYAVAHFKLGMQLSGSDLESDILQLRWAYDFASDERLGIYLTNTLEETEHKTADFLGPLRVITEEANAAARIKRDLPILVVMGNPPYSGHSANKGKWITSLVYDYKKNCPELYKPAQAKWLQDDYVKFIRWGQWRIERTGAGILGFITNHAYLDNPTFRGMRQQLMKAFDEIYILDLHGSAKKREIAPDGSKDENVFDIRQGVAIGIFVKYPRGPGIHIARKLGKRGGQDSPAIVRHAQLWGKREVKSQALLSRTVATTKWTTLLPKPPFCLFVPHDGRLQVEYENGWKVSDILNQNGDPAPGIVTTHDDFAVSWDAKESAEKVNRLLTTKSEERARSFFKLCSQAQWNYERAKRELRNGAWKKEISRIFYRPFDVRWTVYDRNVAVHRRERVMRHIHAGENLVLIMPRRVETAGVWRHTLVSREIVDHVAVSLKTVDYAVPLYLYPDPEENGELFPNGCARHPNLDPKFIADVSARLRLKFDPDGNGDLKKTFGPEDVFHYIYAIFHSPTYRERYADFLKRDFPRVPLTSDRNLFRRLCAFGADLVAFHLLEEDYAQASWTRAGNASPLRRLLTRYPVRGEDRVERGHPKYIAPDQPEPGTGKPLKQGRVYINKEQYFEGVPPEVWEFHVGGYQVCEKWLKDRRGRTLSFEDLTHYQKVVVALHETIRLMAEIDRAIPSWPIE
jgi:hypothetical protein